MSRTFDHVSDFSNGLAQVSVQGKFGFINKEGVIVIEPKYSGAMDFSEELAYVSENNVYGVIDLTGSYVIQPRFSVPGTPFLGGLSLITTKDKQWYIDKSGKTIKEWDRVSEENQ